MGKPLILCLSAMWGLTALAQSGGSDPSQAIAAQLRSLRKVPDDERPKITLRLALEIRQLPAKSKRGFAEELANLATEGDAGRDTLQEVATTLAEALRDQPAPRNGGDVAMP